MDFIGAYSYDNVMYLLQGLGVSIAVAAAAIVLSFILACLLAIIRYARIPVLSQIVTVCVETIRNLPLLLIIFFVYFALPEVGIKMSVFTSAIVALTIFEAAMISEIVRAGLLSIDKGQIEAARSSGLSYIQTLRFITLPQALRRMVPPIVGQFISLIKDTSLTVIISLPELMHSAKVVSGQNFNYVIPIYLLAALFYFIINFTISSVAKRIEVRV
ncbi:amino acid ABC transporter permease [Paenibacillus sp. SC116]|uniref:amino acid ABC transporter permease n=1 Tax=Paenibacillus sp. SC116 TaxID=2968986 RepID=UPI00215A8C34|nr:amino acid ABC transporter permease [Paenibacillus sp. SC116]MCR8846228.1 amino acid ABC transporter permease [Paenibacillus sp. SC116]